ncbi:MAG: RsmE family RNA methyltransferase [Bacillota bacterium]
MHRFFVTEDSVREGKVVFRGEDAHQINRVLRLSPGDRLCAVLVDGREFVVEIGLITQDTIIARIVGTVERRTESPVRVTLLQGLPKGDKIDYIVQKCTELGIDRLVLAVCARSVPRWEERRAKDKISRLTRIACEAAEQSGRLRVPSILGLFSFEEAVNRLATGGLMLIPWEEYRGKGIKDVLRAARSAKEVSVIIGPEGGFDPKEVRAAMDAGATPVRLGPRVLRTETAAVVAVSMVLYELGDLGEG